MTGDLLSPDDRWRKRLTAIVALTIASVVIGLMAVAYVIWFVGRQSGPAARRPQSSSADGLVDAIASPAWQARPSREPWSLPPLPIGPVLWVEFGRFGRFVRVRKTIKSNKGN